MRRSCGLLGYSKKKGEVACDGEYISAFANPEEVNGFPQAEQWQEAEGGDINLNLESEEPATHINSTGAEGAIELHLGERIEGIM